MADKRNWIQFVGKWNFTGNIKKFSCFAPHDSIRGIPRALQAAQILSLVKYVTCRVLNLRYIYLWCE